MKIDAHQHFWKIQRGDYGWITPEVDKLYRDFLPRDLLPHLERHAIEKSIVVQAAPTVEETRFILELSQDNPCVGGVVGWLDLTQQSYKEQFDELSQNPKFVGIRIMIQDMEDPDQILEEQWISALSHFERLDFPIDLLIKSDQLHVVKKLMEQVPRLRGVIDHIGKPKIEDGVLEPWQEDMAALAKYPNLYCKLSGMVTEANHRSWKLDDFVPYVSHVLRWFGPRRTMYGSDWPVCLLAASYDSVYRLADTLLLDVSVADKREIFGGTAARFYKLDVEL